MTTLPQQIQTLLSNYERTFHDVNQNTIPSRVFLGADTLISQYKNISTPQEADTFFEIFGVGNVGSGVHNPSDRQLAYELLLKILQSIDPVQYHKIHKGTPYYFIGWTSYQYKDFAKAIFYMDAAVSEDLKFSEVQNKLATRPALDFFLLKTEAGPSALATHLELYNTVDKTIEKFKAASGGLITIETFRNRFVEDLLYSGAQGRSLLTALYTFLLEYNEKEMQINLRSDSGGSIQPFLDNLFDGARILESLLEKRGGGGGTLKPKITNTTLISVSSNVLLPNKTLADAESQYLSLVSAGSSFQDCNFSSAYIIRNTSGHSLLWPDQFTSGDSYKILYDNLVNSIFWTIEKLWL